ncbi:MAG TPA: hypothetical protein VMB52_02605 [Verrucomicrobiae bacterium]|nr:hypothetical protein [Verrucomicrobiae bacterium]
MGEMLTQPGSGYDLAEVNVSFIRDGADSQEVARLNSASGPFNNRILTDSHSGLLLSVDTASELGVPGDYLTTLIA